MEVETSDIRDALGFFVRQDGDVRWSDVRHQRRARLFCQARLRRQTSDGQTSEIS